MEQWSRMMFSWYRPHIVSEPSLSPEPSSPRRKRMKRMTTLSASIRTVLSFKHIPSPGAVCPAMVTSPFLTLSSDFSDMMPATSNTIVLAPLWFMASLREPVPLSFRLVTCMTLPPRPPVVYIPPPSAPGKARAPRDDSCSGIRKRAYISSGTSGPGSGDEGSSLQEAARKAASEAADKRENILFIVLYFIEHPFQNL